MMKITDRGRNQTDQKNFYQRKMFNQSSEPAGSQQHSRHQRNNVSPWSNNFNASTPFFMLEQQNEFQEYQNRFQQATNELIQQIPQTIFSIHCGEIRPRDEGSRVKIGGKVVKRPRTGRFLEIKDLKGCTQLVATDDKPEISHRFQSIPAGAYIEVIVKVQLRPKNFINNVSSSKLRNVFQT